MAWPGSEKQPQPQKIPWRYRDKRSALAKLLKKKQTSSSGSFSSFHNFSWSCVCVHAHACADSQFSLEKLISRVFFWHSHSGWNPTLEPLCEHQCKTSKCSKQIIIMYCHQLNQTGQFCLLSPPPSICMHCFPSTTTRAETFTLCYHTFNCN